MNWNYSLARVLAGSIASLLVVTSSAYAIPRGPCEQKQQVCCDEPKPGPFAFAYPKDVDLNCPKDFFVYASALAFQAKQDGMAFAIRDGSGQANPFPITNGEVLNFSHDNSDWGYNPGVRVGLGFYMHHDAWSLDFDWTWLNITDYKNFHAQNQEFFLPLWLTPLPVETASGPVNAGWSSVGGKWNAHYNTLDANLGKPYHVSRYFVLNPHFGLRAAWIDQQFSVRYGGIFNGQNGAISHMQNDFWGFGARAGLSSEWIIGKGWNLFGNFAASLLFGKFEVDQQLSMGSGTTDNTYGGYDLNEHFYQNVPNMEIQLGIAWERYFSKERYRICLAGAYEFHEWWDQLNTRKFYGLTGGGLPQVQSDTVSRGNLSLNGFSFTLKLDI